MANIPGRIINKGDEFYTDWFPRGGDGIIVRAERIDGVGSELDLTIETYTKAAETAGVGVKVDDGTGGWDLLVAGDSSGIREKLMISTSSAPNGLRELVRFRLSTGATGSSGDWMRIRIFPPIFFDKAAG